MNPAIDPVNIVYWGFLGVILGLYDPLWHVEWPTKVHEGSGGVLDGLSAVGGALRGFQRPFSR